MEYFLNLPTARFDDPDTWATEAESQGWHGICASDHFWVGHAYPHVFVTATRMAAATSKVLLTTSFCNNLFRSPVEFAQAALALQQAADGRFEAGLGAGWLEDEMTASGMAYPDGPERISRYIEAMQIAKSLLATGQCVFDGEHYQINIEGSYAIGPLSDTPPPLVGSVGGPRGIREVTPIADRIEIKASARGTRGGSMNIPVMATVTFDEVKQNIDLIKNVAPDVPIGIFILTSAGEDPMAQNFKDMFGDGFLGNFHGHPEDVAAALTGLADMGIDRVQLTEMLAGTQEALAPALVSRRSVSACLPPTG